MAKPTDAPPNSDMDGVHRDGTGPGRRLPADGADAGDLDRAREDSAARPNYEEERSRDDRTS